MAKKNLEMDFESFDDGLDFNFDEDITGSIDQEARRNKPRSPVSNAIKGALQGAKDTVKSPSFIQSTLRKALPDTYGEISDNVGDIAQGSYELYNQASQSLKPQLRSIAHKIDQGIPDSSRKLKKISSTILEKLGGREEARVDTRASQEDQSVNQMLASVFEAQQESAKQEDYKQSLRDEIQRKRHQQSLHQQRSMTQDLSVLTQYTTNVTSRYQKKMLEIQLRSFMGQSAFYSDARRYFEAFKVQNEAVIKNTALPDFLKITNSERFKEVAQTRFLNSLWGENSPIRRGMEKLKKSGSEMISGFQQSLEMADMNLESAQSAREQLEEMNKMLVEMGQPPLTKAEMAGAALGSMGVTQLRDWFSGILKKRSQSSTGLNKRLSRVAEVLANPGGALNDFRRSDRWQDGLNEYGTLKSKLFGGLDFIADHFTDERANRSYGAAVGSGDLKNPTMGFDNKAHISLTDIIPGHLAAIRQELTIMRTGDLSTPIQIYDYDKRQFVSRSVMRDQIQSSLQSESEKSYYQYGLSKVAEGFKADDIQLTPENELELKLFLGKLARTPNFRYTPENIARTEAYENLSPDVKRAVDRQLDAMSGEETGAVKQHKFTKDMMAIRSSMPTMDQSLRRYYESGYGDILSELGLGEVKDGQFKLNERGFDDLIDQGTRVRSDINVKEALKRMKPEELLDTVQSRLRDFKSKAKSKWKPKEAYDAFKKTPLYDWFYKQGVGDGQPHSGPMAQDVRENFGEAAAPGGVQIDLQSMNGATMAAVQHLGERLEALEGVKGQKGGYLRFIAENTAMMVDLMRKSGGGFGGVSEDIITRSQTGSGYRSMLESLFSGVLGLAGKVSGDIFGAASKVFGVGKEKVIDPASRAISESYLKNKDKIQETFGMLVQKASNMAGSVMDFGRDLIGGKLPKGMEYLQKGLKSIKAKISEKINSFRDLYLPDGVEPIIRAVKLRAGEYRDSATGQILKTMDDIAAAKGDIVDAAGNIIASAEELREGLVDRYGDKLKSTASILMQGAVGLGMQASQKLMQGLMFLRENGIGAFNKIGAAFKGGWKSLIDKGGIGFHFHDVKNHAVLVDIRDILLGETSEVRDRLKKKLKAAFGGGGSGSGLIDTAGQLLSSAKTNDSTSATSDPRYQGSGSGSLFESAGNLIGGLKDRIMNRGNPATQSETGGDYNYRQTNGQPNGQYRNRRRPAPAPAPAGRFERMRGALGRGFDRLTGGRGGAILDIAGSVASGIGSAASGAMSFLSGFGNNRRLDDPEYQASLNEGEETQVQSHAKGVIPEHERAWNDRDGSGTRDGGVEEREQRIRALQESRKKKAQEADLRLRYKSEENVIDKLAAKAGGVMDMIQNGVSSLFGLGSTLLSSIPGVGAGLAKLGGAAKNLFTGIRGAGFVQGAKTAARSIVGGVVSAGASIAKRAGAFAVMKALPTTLMSAASLGGGAIASVGSLLLSSIIIKAAIVGAAGYGIWKLYKYATRNNANGFELMRLMQYGLGTARKDRANYHRVYTLEAYLQDGRVSYTGGEIALNSRKIAPEDLLEIFSIDKEDTEKAEKFNSWFHGRFTPFFLAHMKALYAVDTKASLDKVKDLEALKMIQYLEAVKLPSGPYTVLDSPFVEIDELQNNLNNVQDVAKKLIDGLKSKLKAEPESKSPLRTAGQEEASKKLQTKPAEEKKVEKPTEASKVLDQKQKTAEEKAKALSVVQEPLEYGEDGGKSNEGSGSASNSGSSTMPATGRPIPLAAGGLSSGQSGMSFLKLGRNVDISRLHPKVGQLFLAMAEEYGKLTGKSIQVNDGWRDSKEQARLYNTLPRGRAAPPGKSLHEYGLAIDINTADANELEKLGLMRKYGFTRPVGQETWHLEPAGIQRDLDQARQDPAARDRMVAASIMRGGGGVALLPNFKKYGRDRGYALSVMNAGSVLAQTTPPGSESVAANDSVMEMKSGEQSTEQRSMAQNMPSPEEVSRQTSLAMGDAEKPVSSSGSMAVSGRVGGYLGNQAPSGQTSASDQSIAQASGNGSDSKPAGSSGGDIKSVIADAAKKTGMDPNILLAMAAVESDFNPNARSRSSTAGGLFQFLDSTWKEQLAKHGRKYGLDPNASKFDAHAASILGAEYLKQNLRTVSGLGRGSGVVEAYLTHFLGAGGAKTFLSAKDDAIAASIMPKAAASNPSIFFGMGGRPLTIAEVYENISSRVQKKASHYGLQLPTTPSKPEMGGAQGITLPSSGPATLMPSGGSAPSMPKAEEPKMVSSESGGIFVSRTGNSDLARSRREQGEAMAGPSMSKLESSMDRSVELQSESLEVLKSILGEVKTEKVAEVLAAAVAAAMKASQPNPLKEADNRNLGRRTETSTSALDMKRHVA